MSDNANMIDSLKKTLLAGLGAAVVTRDKVLSGIDDFVREGKISAADAREMAERIAKEGRREFDEVSAKLGEKGRHLMAYADGRVLSRIEDLERRVAALEVAKGKKKKRRTGS